MPGRRIALLALAVLELVLALLGRTHRTCTVTAVPGFERVRWRVGRWRAWRTADRARRLVPAYRQHCEEREGSAVRPSQLSALPETDKRSYIRPHRLEDLCRGGRLPRRGVVLDESSGSSGPPTTWVRGPDERRATAALLRATFTRTVGAGPVVVINAFSMGAWATGLHVSMALTDVTRITSVGPDRDKVLATLTTLGPRHRYVLLGYPPFLKDVADDGRVDLRQFDITAGFGGEGLSEHVRSHLLRSYGRVIGSYGASDLEINLAAETDFTVCLRRELQSNGPLRTSLTAGRPPTLPMIFQFNPLDYVLETNERGELVVTVCRAANLSPRIRYNIGDIARVVRMPHLVPLLRRHAPHLLRRGTRRLDLPVLLHFGRSDLSIDWYGAVVSPQVVREALEAQPAVTAALRSFRLIGYEDATATTHLVIAVELQPGRAPRDLDAAALPARVTDALCRIDGDVASAARASGRRPRVRLFAAGTGPFAVDHGGLKHRYVSRLDHASACALGVAG